MSSSFTLNAGVYFNWLDAGVSPTAIATSIGGLVFHSNRGSLSPQEITGYDQFQSEYGPSDYTVSYGWDTARAFFRVGQAAVAVRSPGVGAEYAGAIVANNKIAVPVTTANPTGFAYDGTAVSPISSSVSDYSTINFDAWDLIFSGELPSTGTIRLTINNVQTAVVTSNGDHVVTMNNLATAINNALLTIAGVTDYSGASATVINRPGVTVNPLDPTTTPRTIRIVGPQNTPLTISAITLTNNGTGANTVVVTAMETEWLFFGMAENPGGWGANIAMQTSQLSLGRNSSVKMQLGGAADPLNSFVGTINGVTITVPPNAGGNNAFLTDIAAAITANVPNTTATVTSVTGVNNNRAIVVTANNNSFDITIQSPTLMQNGALGLPPFFTISTLVTRYVPPTDFTLTIYEYPDLQTVVNTYQATFQETIDATGNETNFSMLVNNGHQASDVLRVLVNPLAIVNNWQVQGTSNLNPITREGFLGGGVDGALSTSADIIDTWQQLSNTQLWVVRILMNCGYSTIDVQQAIDALCQSRRDCVGILDLDLNSQGTGQDAVNYRNATNINSSYVTMYTPNIKIYDVDRRILRYSPPSGYVGAIYAFTDMTQHEWWSPSGLTRGWIPEAQGLYVDYSDGDLQLLNAAQINPIINYMNRQITVFGDWTLYFASSPFQYIGTRRMCNTIEITATQTVALSLFEPNNAETRNNVVKVSNTILQTIKDGQGINNFTVVDLTQSYNIDARQAYFRYIIDPTTSIHQILIDGIVTQANASFTEYTTLTANSNVANSNIPVAA